MMRSISSNPVHLRIAAAFLGACLLLPAGCTGDTADDDETSEGGERVPAAPEGGAGARALRKGDRGPEVEAVYRYLRRYGYFPDEQLASRYEGFRPAVHESPADVQVFDDVLEAGLRIYQRTMGLPEDGTLNEATAALMAQPRSCEHPDLYTGPPNEAAVVGTPGSYVWAGSKWSTNNLSYRIANYTPDLPASTVDTAIRRSFVRWAAVSPLFFANSINGGDIVISFGDIDGPGGYAAWAYYPPNGDIVFDETATWTSDGQPRDLESDAMHEIGHALGLGHSSYGTVMYPYYVYQRELGLDDIQGIQAIYGKAAPLAWSQDGPIAGQVCVKINEPSDPDAWQDNYLCSSTNLGIVWSYAGPVAGMRCTQISEAAEPASHTWNDNYLCVPTSSKFYFTWSSSGPVSGWADCTQIYESSDPHTWMENFLCYTQQI